MTIPISPRERRSRVEATSGDIGRDVLTLKDRISRWCSPESVDGRNEPLFRRFLYGDCTIAARRRGERAKIQAKPQSTLLARQPVPPFSVSIESYNRPGIWIGSSRRIDIATGLLEPQKIVSQIARRRMDDVRVRHASRVRLASRRRAPSCRARREARDAFPSDGRRSRAPLGASRVSRPALRASRSWSSTMPSPKTRPTCCGTRGMGLSRIASPAPEESRPFRHAQGAAGPPKAAR
jgi:hypothetical protein